MTPTPWEYRAQLDRIVDGDTLDVQVDMGFRMAHFCRLRVLGINAPEPRGASREAGRAATEYVAQWMEAAIAQAPNDWPLMIRTVEVDSFGRWLADIWDSKNNNLAADMLEDGQAIPYEK